MISTAIVIPFRDRGRDPLRQQNLDTVLEYWKRWWTAPIISVVDDGGAGDEQFNRSRAYNRAVADMPNTDVFVFAESDMIVDPSQILDAINAAHESPGLVVPFTQYRYLTPKASRAVRAGSGCPWDVESMWTMDNGRAIGAVNVVSRMALDMVGRYDECFTGSWWDDRAMRHAFDVCCNPTRWIDGPAYHLYHLPGWQGGHLTQEDLAATRANKLRHRKYMHSVTPKQVRKLTLEDPR